jgi:hypothetical protein
MPQLRGNEPILGLNRVMIVAKALSVEKALIRAKDPFLALHRPKTMNI